MSRIKMDIDDLKETLRKKTGDRSADRVKALWQDINSRKNLTTREKLEKLLEISRKQKKEQPGKTVPAGESPTRGGSGQPFLIIENSYNLGARYGQIPLFLGLNIPGQVLAVLARDREFEGLTLSGSVFIDLETTGLAGGTGTVPFLVGLGFFENDSLKIVQYFLNDLAAEGRMLEDLRQLLEEKKFTSVVSYNGKGFDLPLLETRFTLNRMRLALSSLPHLDFLYSARHLWKHKYESCRLYELALNHLGVDRAEDIPSEEIPWRYFQYLRSGDFSLVEPIFYHNQEDLMSLYGVVLAGSLLVARTLDQEEVDIEATELLGVGKILERAGQVERSVTYYEKALDKNLPEQVSARVRKNLAQYFKRQKRWEKSIQLWQHLLQNSEDLECFRELAIYYEHHRKDPEEALKYALDGLALSRGRNLKFEQDFRKRVERLNQKVQKLKTVR
ncbi:MAG: ribonuclease H-like domain-containing protein [Candidatus Saccharicenans sp.]|nr:ribonuclease H-like domain-containing protein [Candidatus Saccharicenans sp.]MDI6849056.1 ribonuclease H-like domain-containing protein [Candidatus Saccharicenans sp.]